MHCTLGFKKRMKKMIIVLPIIAILSVPAQLFAAAPPILLYTGTFTATLNNGTGWLDASSCAQVTIDATQNGGTAPTYSLWVDDWNNGGSGVIFAAVPSWVKVYNQPWYVAHVDLPLPPPKISVQLLQQPLNNTTSLQIWCRQ
jgi:hypothetical protein